MTKPEWSELEAQFGVEAVTVIDKAICATLDNYPMPIAAGDRYLVSEHLTFEVLMAMRAADLRFDKSVATFQRVACPVCGANTTLTKNGRVRTHRRESEGGICPTSKLPAFRTEDDTA